MIRIHRYIGLGLLIGGVLMASAATTLARVQSQMSWAQDTQPPPGAPTAPDGCQAQLVNVWGIWQAFVTWNDRSSNEDGFILEWRLTNGGSSWSGTTSVGANTTSAWAPAGNSGTHARYRVKSFNALGESHWSNWASATVP